MCGMVEVVLPRYILDLFVFLAIALQVRMEGIMELEGLLPLLYTSSDRHTVSSNDKINNA
jgi:hypothetical protein